MKKLSLKKLLSLCAGFALALVSVVTFTATNKQLSANAEEPTLPDTSTWEEVDACPGDALIGTWYRVYYTEDYFNKNFDVDILTFMDNSYDTTYSGDWTQETAPTDAYVGAVKLWTTKEKQICVNNAGNITELLMCNFTDEYVDFCIPSTLVLDMGIKYSVTISQTISREITLKPDATISVVYNELKRLEEPTNEPTNPGDSTETPDEPTNPGDSTETPDEPTNPGDSTETPDEPTNPGDSTETPDDNTDEPKQEMTDKFSNWLNDTFGFKTTGSVVGSIALLVAGFFIVKALFGKK